MTRVSARRPCWSEDRHLLGEEAVRRGPEQWVPRAHYSRSPGLSWASLGALAPHHLLQVSGTGRPRPASARVSRCRGQTVRARRAKPLAFPEDGAPPAVTGRSLQLRHGNPCPRLAAGKASEQRGPSAWPTHIGPRPWAAPATPASVPAEPRLPVCPSGPSAAPWSRNLSPFPSTRLQQLSPHPSVGFTQPCGLLCPTRCLPPRPLRAGPDSLPWVPRREQGATTGHVLCTVRVIPAPRWVDLGPNENVGPWSRPLQMPSSVPTRRALLSTRAASRAAGPAVAPAAVPSASRWGQTRGPSLLTLIPAAPSHPPLSWDALISHAF